MGSALCWVRDRNGGEKTEMDLLLLLVVLIKYFGKWVSPPFYLMKTLPLQSAPRA